jgi:hypothetical protein
MNDRTIYVSPDGIEFDELPGLYNNISPITLDNYEQLGWTTRVEQKKEPVIEVTQRLAEKEKAYIAELMEQASSFEIDLLNLPDMDINSLKQAAKDAGATDKEVSSMTSSLMVLAFDIMSETDQPWSVTWRGLKSRMVDYMRELTSS